MMIIDALRMKTNESCIRLPFPGEVPSVQRWAKETIGPYRLAPWLWAQRCTNRSVLEGVQLSGRNWLGEEIVAHSFSVPRGEARP